MGSNFPRTPSAAIACILFLAIGFSHGVAKAGGLVGDLEAIRSKASVAHDKEHDGVLSTTSKVFDYLFHHPYSDQSIALAKSVSQHLSPEMIDKLWSIRDGYTKAEEAGKNDPRGTAETKFWNENKKRVGQVLLTALQGSKVISHELQDGLRGVVYDVDFEGKPMRVSYFFGHDEIKFAPVPEADDVIYQRSLAVPATLMGATFDLKKGDVLIDASKAYSILGRISPQLDIMRDGNPELIQKAMAKVETLFSVRMNDFERPASPISSGVRTVN